MNQKQLLCLVKGLKLVKKSYIHHSPKLYGKISIGYLMYFCLKYLYKEEVNISQSNLNLDLGC